MKRLFVPFLAISFVLYIPFYAFANNAVDLCGPAAPLDTPPLDDLPLVVLPPVAGPLLYDNGPLVNSRGTGAGGADESVLQTTLGMNTYGFECQSSSKLLGRR